MMAYCIKCHKNNTYDRRQYVATFVTSRWGLGEDEGDGVLSFLHSTHWICNDCYRDEVPK